MARSGCARCVVGEHPEPVDVGTSSPASFPTSVQSLVVRRRRPTGTPAAAPSGSSGVRPSSTPRPTSSPGRATTPPASPSSAPPTISARAPSTTTSAPRRSSWPPSTTGSWTRSWPAPTGWPRRVGRRRGSWPCWATSCSTSSTAIPITCGSSCTSSRPSPASAPSSSGCGGGEYERAWRPSCAPASRPASSADLDPWLTARAWLGMHNYTYLWLKPGGRLVGPVGGPAVRRHLHAGHRQHPEAGSTPEARTATRHGAEYPPSTTRAAPVVQRESSPAR